jgi:mRNA interferase MazF
MEIARGSVVLMVVTGDLGRPRPGIVVQSDDLGADTFTVLICPSTSDIDMSRLLRPIVEPTEINGLRLQSQLMTDKLMPLRRDRIRRVIGKLEPDALDALNRALLVVLGLAR